VFLALFLAASVASAQSDITTSRIQTRRVRNLPEPIPASREWSRVFIVVDPIDDSDCDRDMGGGGTAERHICMDNGVEWVPVSGTGSGSSIILDLDDDDMDESTSITEIASDNDTGGIMSEPSPDKLLFDFGDVCLEDGTNCPDTGGMTTRIASLTPALCQSTTANLTWNVETSGGPTATCVDGTNTFEGVATFSGTTEQCLQGRFMLPNDYAGPIDVEYMWRTTATTGSASWCLQIACVGNSEAGDPSFPSQASGNCVSDAADGTGSDFNLATLASVTSTGCAASEVMYFKLCRNADGTGSSTDDITADGILIDGNLILTVSP
jgi:hypothetical protein